MDGRQSHGVVCTESEKKANSGGERESLERDWGVVLIEFWDCSCLTLSGLCVPERTWGEKCKIYHCCKFESHMSLTNKMEASNALC